MKWFFKTFILIVILVIIVLLVNTLRVKNYDLVFTPNLNLKSKNLQIDRAAESLSQAIRFQTISQGKSKTANIEFKELNAYLQNRYKSVFSNLKMKQIGNSFFLIWEGQDQLIKPILFLAHLDVVPVENIKSWVEPPFSGKIDKDFIWGRGALDNKASLIAHFEALKLLLESGFQPKRTLYFAFGADEEVGGSHGAKEMASYFKDKNLQFDFILDEGGMVNEGAPLGIHGPMAYIGIAEKGYGNIILEAQADPGHSSMPPKMTAVQRLARALSLVERDILPSSFEGPTASLFEYVAYKLPLIKKVIFANSWLFKPIITKVMSAKNVTNAFVRTTLAPTLIEGGVKENVLPTYAKATINIRTIPGDNIELVQKKLEAKINDPMVILSIEGEGKPASHISAVTSPEFIFLGQQIRSLNSQITIAPFLFIGGTDSIHYQELSKNIFRFSPFYLSESELTQIHGENEKISKKNLEQMILFYMSLYKY